MLSTAVIGVGHLGSQHARIHAELAAEGRSQFKSVCDIDADRAGKVAAERRTDSTTDWRDLIGKMHAVGIPILTNRVDAANARLEFETGAVANITASRVGTQKIRKMRFFQPRDYIVVDYATNHASISNLAPSNVSSWPGVNTRVLEA